MDELTKISDQSDYDVVIIGAGPAGTCAALRLLQLDYRVAIIEQAEFPRFQIGESLSPGVWNIFQYLEAEELLLRPEYIRNLSAYVIWEQPTENRLSASQRGPGIIVDRAKLDSELLALCRQRGAVVFQPAKIKTRKFNDGGWHLEINSKNGKYQIQTFFIFDARGKNGVPTSDRIQTSPVSVGIWTHLPARYFPKATLVEALEDAWLWGSPLPNGEFKVMAFADPSTIKNVSISTCLAEFISKSDLFKISYSFEKLDFTVRPVQLFWNAYSWKKNYIHLGESAFAFDPLSSTGVEKAMRFSMQTVIAFNTIVKKNEGEKIAGTFYTEKLLEAVATHTNWTQEFYARSWVDNSFPFWAKRCTPFYAAKWTNTSQEKLFTDALNCIKPISPDLSTEFSIRKTLTELNDIPIRISPDLTYREMPCVVGDLLELKIAIVHPGLAQPTAFLGNVEIAPLLKELELKFTLKSVIDRWTILFGSETSVRAAVTLWGIGIFEKAEL